MNANKWYSIAQTTVFDTSCGINITFGNSSSVLFTASVKYGVSSLNISSCSIEGSYNISVRLRETESKWCVDLLSNIEINPTIDITDSPYWIADNSLAGNGAVIAIIENISKEFNTTGGGGSGEGGESLFDRINIGTDANPQYAVVPKDFNGSYVHIVSRGDVLAGGEGTPGEPGQGATTLGGLNNVDAGADEIYNTDKVLVKLSLGSHWRAIDLSSVVGLDTNALERYLTTNNYATTSDIETAIGPVSEKVNGFDDRIAILESLGLSLVEQDGTTYLKSEHSFCTEKDIFAGGIGEEGPSSGGIIQQVYGASAFGGTFDSSNLTETFNAHAINSLYNDIQILKNSGGGGVADSVDWAKVYNKPTTLGGYGITDALSTSGGTISGTLTVAEIKNSAGNVLISQSSGNSTYVGNSAVKTVLFGATGLLADINGTRYNVIHSGNYSDYTLSKGGGTIANSAYDAFKIKRSSSSGAYVTFENNDGRLGLIGIEQGTFEPVLYKGSDTSAYYYFIHSGNIGDYAMKYYGNQGAINFNDVLYNGIQYTSSSSSNNGKEYGILASFWCGDSSWQIVGGRTDELLYRSGNGTSISWRNWKTIAFTDSNVASATKLQTGRYLWGNYFNGEQNISSALFLNSGGDGIYVDYNGINYHNSNNGWIATNINFQSNGGLWLSPHSGNVIIGTTEDNGAKLQVEGTTLVKGSNGYGILIGAGANTIDAWRDGGNTDLWLNWQSTGHIKMVNGGGNVLIGTSSDNGHKLQVNGTIDGAIFTSKTRSSASVNTTGCFRWGSFDEGTGGFKMQFGGPDSTLTILDYQWTKGLFAFQSSGNFIATGDITAGSSASDMRLKDIVCNDYDAVSIIKNLSTFKYKWNSTAKSLTDCFSKDNYEHFGLSAQEVEKVSGYLVSNFNYGEGREYLTLKKDELVPLLVQAVKQLLTRIEILEGK